MDLGALKTTDCVSEPCAVRAYALLFGEEPEKPSLCPVNW